MLNWDDYRLILAMARAGSVRGAATALGVNHSTVSRRLAGLSKISGGDVFERKPGGYRSTALGDELVSAAERMEAIVLETARRSRAAHGDMSGPITLSIPNAMGSVLLLDDLLAFAGRHPEIQLDVRSSYSFADLDHSEADIVVRGTNSPDDHLVGRKLFPYAMSFYCAVGYLEDIPEDERSWLVRSTSPTDTAWIAGSPFPDAKVAAGIDDVDLRHEAAARGHGMIRGVSYITDADPRLMRIPGSRLKSMDELWVLTHPDLRNIPRIKALMGMLCTALLARQDLLRGQSGKP